MQIVHMRKRRNRMVGHIMMNQLGTYSVHQTNKRKSQNAQIERESQKLLLFKISAINELFIKMWLAELTFLRAIPTPSCLSLIFAMLLTKFFWVNQTFPNMKLSANQLVCFVSSHNNLGFFSLTISSFCDYKRLLSWQYVELTDTKEQKGRVCLFVKKREKGENSG